MAGVDSNFRVGNTHSFGVRAVATRDRDLDGLETSGYLFDASVRKTGRNLSYILAHYALSPDFETDVGFVRRTDQQATFAMAAYQWWPEHWIINWGPTFNYMRGYNFDRVLEDEQASAGVTLSFTNNIRFNTRINRDMERFGGVNFFKTRYRFNTVVSADRRYAFGVGGDGGDQIFYDDTSPYLGRDRGWNAFLSLRAFPRWRSRFTLDTNRFVDVRDQNTVFDVNIIRGVTTYQFTDRLLFRNITEYNSLDQDVSLNFLFTYRVNAGTVFYIGYDERYQQADLIEHDDGDPVNNRFFQSTDLTRTNRAVFLKFQYLFRL